MLTRLIIQRVAHPNGRAALSKALFYSLIAIGLISWTVSLILHEVSLQEELRGWRANILPSTDSRRCRRVFPERYYDGTCARRPIADDLISQITFKLSADYHFGSLPQPPNVALCNLTMDVLPKLWDGMVIYVDSPEVPRFVSNVMPHIKTMFVLVSGDSILGNPSQLKRNVVTSVLRSPQLLHWYAKNCEYNPNPQMFTCLNLGVSQWDERRNSVATALRAGLGITCDLKQNLARPKAHRDGSIIVSFEMKSNPTERQPAWDAFCNDNSTMKPFSRCYFAEEKLTIEEHYRRISQARFVVSPHGYGLDCYRTYETLYLGSYPIVKTSSIDELYKGLPVLIVDNWQEVTPELLAVTYKKFRAMSFDYRRLFKWYWFKRFRSHIEMPTSYSLSEVAMY